MNKAYLLTGGNLGNREDLLGKARDHINKECGSIITVSSLYETEAWGKIDQPLFLNQAIELDTLLDARGLMRCILKTEERMGRRREEKYGPRIIDIDILLFNNEIHNDQFLKLPHPEMQNRRFALLPLADIAPHLIHPVLNMSIIKLLELCPDHLAVKKYH